MDTTELSVDERGARIEEAITKVSDIDNNAMELAVQLKERFGGKVGLFMALTWGPMQMRLKDIQKAAKKLLAMGGDEATLIVDEKLFSADSFLVAKALAAAIKKGSFDLVIAGEGSIDNFSGQIGPRVAEELSYKFIGFVSRVSFRDGDIILTKSMEGYEEDVLLDLPAVISVTQEINKPRIPSLSQVLSASKLPMKTLSLSDLGVVDEGRVKLVEIRPRKIERKMIKVEGSPNEAAENLLDLLIKEGVLLR
ncbi:MAG: electron transfer flavoprotein subunit beta [Thermoproteota archaeon]|uniref:Electron transfer flavoprotein subunit beta/FixA family protein n=1 Tax=Candidatus Methanodesulfokora washburnensis TaxID=2478471 RepID=A0A3R9Q1F0_9CREN|nr:electron transfer flavoprotein subunit beta/FixA family protein [Candidatus Methanodesulfokores washburnensis]RSN78723.1 electron transfer flavoprotein subunit beta/FixA family protein [Candidatus Methanodesulfokores washburnensis]RZN59831.1 MAG: electron transfer flavoprotein subunit beta/FixA family protein [Candidatus Methanodesulfokores washburnensis]TDA41036.1 MAG: electron transfer flavoprotein subunit beta [Candidatus Korarchaeota archaeon]